MSAPTLTLGRDGMGGTPSEEEWLSWVMFVCNHIDAAAGMTVDIEEHNKRDVQDDTITGCDDEARERIYAAKQDLWEQWCAEGAVSQ